jgi:hypothetical protein
MRGYAKARQLNRKLVNLPILTIPMLAIGADAVTPLPYPYLRILIEGLKSEVLVRDPLAQEVFNVDLIPYAKAVQLALMRDGSGEVESFWSGTKPGSIVGRTHMTTEGMFIEQLRLESAANVESVYKIFSAVGGDQGFYYARWLWQVRGILDKLVGGPGMQRRRGDPLDLKPGEVVGGYIVEKLEPGHILRLRNNLKAPGPAWMQFEALASANGKTLYVQTAFFEPHGLAGLAYWYALYPFHQLIFNGLARNIVRHAAALDHQN